MAIDYDDINAVNVALGEAQKVEQDNRNMVREAHHFLDKRDGQWEPSVLSNMGNRPRYTFDKCGPIVDDIQSSIEETEFAIRIRPSGGGSSVDDAKVYNGIIRNIENMSRAEQTYMFSSRAMVEAGLGGWEVAHDWVDGDSFEQDLLIKPIYNYEDRVWFQPGAEEQTQADAEYVFVLQDVPKSEYKERFPDGSQSSVDHNRDFSAYTHRPEVITVGRILYKQREKREIILFSDGSVREDNADLRKVKNELKQAGITEKSRKTTEKVTVISRLFDRKGFLTEKEPTVFKWLPIIPLFGNFKVRESKVVYRGAIEKLMDAQRSYNYKRSRETEQIGLSPKPKYWMTRKQASNPSDQEKLASLNTNMDPVQFYTPDENAPGPPPFIGGTVIDPGLQNSIQNDVADIQAAASTFDPQEVQVRGPLSQVAIEALNARLDSSAKKFFNSIAVAICHTGQILVDAIPVVYDTRRQMVILGEDGSEDEVTVNDRVYDQETREFVEVNNLRKGKYSVTCDIGPRMKTKQQETVRVMTELSEALPGLLERNADILLQNIPSPGINSVLERERRLLLEAGAIPESQQTDDEKAEIEEAQQLALTQEQEPTPQDKLANAEIGRVQAETQKVINDSALKAEDLRIKEQKNLLDAQNAAEKLQMDELGLFLKQQQSQIEQQNALIEANMKGQAQIVESLNTQAETLKTLREAMGVDTIVGPGNTEAYIKQADIVTEQQEDQRQ